MNRERPTRYSDPYVCGIGLGAVLLATFVIMGRGLGASGAVATLAAAGVEAADPAHAGANDFLAPYLERSDGPPLRSWIVFEVLGIFAGAFISAALAGRLRRRIDRGRQAGVPARLAGAFGGGGLMAFGAAMAGGCTSGLALSGGAMLGVGAWVFMIALFVGGFAAAPLVRRQWL